MPVRATSQIADGPIAHLRAVKAQRRSRWRKAKKNANPKGVCRACKNRVPLGRDDICGGCYRRLGSRVHDVALKRSSPSKTKTAAVVRSYRKRDETLHLLGFASYAAYLESPAWADIRARALAANPKCCLCGATAEVVHHDSYDRDTLSGLSLMHLNPLCRHHHELVEFDARGQKRTCIHAHRVFLRLKKQVRT